MPTLGRRCAARESDNTGENRWYDQFTPTHDTLPSVRVIEYLRRIVSQIARAYRGAMSQDTALLRSTTVARALILKNYTGKAQKGKWIERISHNARTLDQFTISLSNRSRSVSRSCDRDRV